MKLKPLVPAILLFGLAFSFDGCSDKCRVTAKYSYYTPVYNTTAEIKAQAGMQQARDVKSPGRIYVKDHLLFVNEHGEGIHIFDNHDPAHPTTIGFLNLPGNIDLAVRGNTLYADSYIDLVVFDISDIHQIKEIKRIEGMFNLFTSFGFGLDPQKGIVTSWKAAESVTIEESECDTNIQPWGGVYYADGIGLSSAAFSSTVIPAIPRVTNGQGGSTARFAISGHFLYGLDGQEMEVIDIDQEKTPVVHQPVAVNWGTETLFPHENHLFLGSRTGMFIYDISTPEQPAPLGAFQHVESCDPVVVEGDLAYVTLFSGNACNAVTDQLQVIDITDVTNPFLVSLFPMTNPHGLAIDNGTLFICDGSAGLKIFDASDPLSIGQHLIAQYASINALDIILVHPVAMMIGTDGIYQYDYSNLEDIRQLSSIPIVKL